MDVGAYIEKIIQWALTNGLQIVLVIVIAFVARRLLKALVRRAFSSVGKRRDDPEYQKRTETMGSVISHVITIAIMLVAGMTVLKELGIDIGPVLAAAGIAGLAVGFGSQQLVQDVISGFFILIEDQIRTGDVVEVAGKGGLVEKVTLRMTVLRDLAGNVHFVRNGHIDVVTNMTKEYSRYVFEVGVAYREDVDQVIEVIRQLDEELRADPVFGPDILEPIEILGLDQFADSAVIIKARTKTMPVKQWGVGREFNRRLKKKFDEMGIEIPFPHVTLYMGQDKDGEAPPLRVRTEPGQSLGRKDPEK